MANLTVTSNQSELNDLIAELGTVLAKINGFQLSFSIVSSETPVATETAQAE